MKADVDTCNLRDYAANGTPGAPANSSNVAGIVLVAEWGWGEKCVDEFKMLQSKLMGIGGEYLYIYPARATHITIATLSSFRDPKSPRSKVKGTSGEDRLLDVWSKAVQSIFKEEQDQGSFGAFELEANEVEMSPGAVIVKFVDRSGFIERIRERIRNIFEAHPTLQGLDSELGLPKGCLKHAVQIPNIIHSSLARFTSLISESVGENIMEKFETFAKNEFQTFRVQIKNVTLANEVAPYMHMTKGEGTICSIDLVPSKSESTRIEHPPGCDCGLHQMISLHEMAAKRKQFREMEQMKAKGAASLVEAIGEKLKIAEESGNRRDIVILKRRLKKALISTHSDTAELPSIHKLDYEDFSEFEFFGQRVYIGRFRPAIQQPHLLVRELAVAGILNVTDEFDCPTADGLDTRKIPVKDRPSEGPRMAAYFRQASAFIDGLNKRPVYIHCRQGVSRSVTVLLAHLIVKGMDLRTGYGLIKKGRPCARPNNGFWEELCKLEQNLLKCNSLPLQEYAQEYDKVTS